MNVFKADIADHPSRNTPFDVPYFQVVCNRKRIKRIRLSPALETEKQAREMMDEIKKIVPDAFIVHSIELFSSEHDENRQAVISSTVPASQWGGYHPAYLREGVACVKGLLADSHDPVIQETEEDLQTLLIKLEKLAGGVQ